MKYWAFPLRITGDFIENRKYKIATMTSLGFDVSSDCHIWGSNFYFVR